MRCNAHRLGLLDHATRTAETPHRTWTRRGAGVRRGETPVALAVQVGAWALLGGAVAAGVLVVGAYAALLLTGAAWVPMPEAGFTWREWRRSQGDPGWAFDRLYWVLVLGGLLLLQLAQTWLSQQNVSIGTATALVLSPSALMLVIIESRRRARRRDAQRRVELDETSTPSSDGA